MNEDDTFNALRRIPFEQLRRKIDGQAWIYSAWVDVIESSGWTIPEYIEISHLGNSHS